MSEFNKLYNAIIAESNAEQPKIAWETVEQEFRYTCTEVFNSELKLNLCRKLFVQTGSYMGGTPIGKTFKLCKKSETEYKIWLEVSPYDDLYPTPEIRDAQRGYELTAEDAEDLLDQCVDVFFSTFPQYA